jgi:hypothetical protein
MLFRGIKDKDRGSFQQIAIKDAELFNRSIQDLRTDMYACSVNFIEHSALVQAGIGQIPPDYAKYADIELEKDIKGLAKYFLHDLPIQLVPDTHPPY